MTKLIVLVLTLAATLVSGGSYGNGGGFYKGGAGNYQGFKGQYQGGFKGQYPGGGGRGYGQTYPTWPGHKGGHQHGPYCHGYEQYGGGPNHYAAGQFQGAYSTGVQGFESYPSYSVDNTYATTAFAAPYSGPQYADSAQYATGSLGTQFAASYPNEYTSASSSFPMQGQYSGAYPNEYASASSSAPMQAQYSGAYPYGEYQAASSSNAYPGGIVGRFNQGPAFTSSSLQPLAATSTGDFASMPFQSSGNVWTSQEILQNQQFANADSKFLQQGSLPITYRKS